MIGDSSSLDAIVRSCQRLHSLIGDGLSWQLENPTVGGRMWLRSQVPGEIAELLNRLKRDTPEVLGTEYCPLVEIWNDMRGLLYVLNRRAETIEEEKLNKAMPLLLAASGVTWHWLTALMRVSPVCHSDLDGIEPLDVVLERAGRAGLAGKSPDEIAPRLIGEMREFMVSVRTAT